MTNNSMIRLVSPNLKSDELVFYWQQNAKVATEENKYIINTIRWVIRDVDELKKDKDILLSMDKIDLKSYSSVKELSEMFNRKLIILKEEWSKNKMIPSFMNRRAKRDHLRHILDYCYGKAVDEPDKLNQYVPFSAEVYGETSFELVDQIIEWVKFKADDVFIDLGSGVGQVVLQVAATTDCRFCCGIEKADYPTKCALILEQEFKKLMQYFGKPYNQFTLIKGDFLGDEYQETISGSTVIFANNFAFGPVVDHQLKNRFTSLKEGAKIISSKAFCPLKFRITDRNLDDIGSIMRVTSLGAMENAVSWTCTAFSYYLHEVDHSMLEDYFAKYKQTRATVANGDGVHDGEGQTVVTHRQHVTCGVDGEDSSDEEIVPSVRPPVSKHESPGRRASERLLRNSRKRPQRVTDGPAKRASLSRRGVDENKRPKDADRRNLEQLHRRTMDAIGGRAASANGGADMTRFEARYRPREFRDPRRALETVASETDGVEGVVPVAVQEYLALVRHRLMTHLGHLHSPAYRAALLEEITNQLALRDQLAARVSDMEAQIPHLHREGVALLSSHLHRLGIRADSPSTFFSEARALIREQARAEADNGGLRREIGDLVAAQRDLRDRLRHREALARLLHLGGGLGAHGDGTDPALYSPISRPASPADLVPAATTNGGTQ